MFSRFTWLFNKYILIDFSVTAHVPVSKHITQDGLTIMVSLSAKGMREVFSVEEFGKCVFRKGNAFSSFQVLGSVDDSVLRALCPQENLFYNILPLCPFFGALSIFDSQM